MKDKRNNINWILIISLLALTCKHNHVLGLVVYLTGNLITARKKLLSLFLVSGYLCQLAGVHYIITLQQICFVFPFKSLFFFCFFFLLRWAAFSPGSYPSPSAKTKWIIFSFTRQRSCSWCHKFDTTVIVAFKKWWPGKQLEEKKKKEKRIKFVKHQAVLAPFSTREENISILCSRSASGHRNSRVWFYSVTDFVGFCSGNDVSELKWGWLLWPISSHFLDPPTIGRFWYFSIELIQKEMLVERSPLRLLLLFAGQPHETVVFNGFCIWHWTFGSEQNSAPICPTWLSHFDSFLHLKCWVY